ncbi:hypothetical protein [Pseudodesulfovibrio sediminis]|uniref:Xylose isomerase-like TIM barrel domain-containing protein n=1 Tax=Pseudodesulfovibrio sediminis TaxID=2810563 RepID=A0ABM7P847_9BACT|nr:hypothetical protein [Pseudodesulfovibrio sediminis]BCS89201.1 hypothetical protein PSDVSF_24430 [Pseudodesulfovibrio sediminis]
MSAITLALQGIVAPELRDYGVRIPYAAKTFGHLVDGLEIGMHAHMAPNIAQRILRPDVKKTLREFSRNSLHFAAHPDHPVDSEVLSSIIGLSSSLYEEGLIHTVSFHLDMQPFLDTIRQSLPLELRVLFENLDGRSTAFNTLEAMVQAVRDFPGWGVLLDVAHVLEMQEHTGQSVQDFFSALGDSIRQIHFSMPGHLYEKDDLWPGFEAMHSFAFLGGEAAFGAYQSVDLLSIEHITLEGVIPPNHEDYVAREIEYLKSLRPSSKSLS